LVVSANLETLDGLTSYFSRAGMSCESRRVANPLAELPQTVRALVVFPDDFPAHEIASYLSLVGTRRPDLAMVLVTRDLAAYAELRAIDGRALRASLLSRPAFGWSILDEIRAALACRSDREPALASVRRADD
jgi:hypothetical protein